MSVADCTHSDTDSKYYHEKIEDRHARKCKDCYQTELQGIMEEMKVQLIADQYVENLNEQAPSANQMIVKQFAEKSSGKVRKRSNPRLLEIRQKYNDFHSLFTEDFFCSKIEYNSVWSQWPVSQGLEDRVLRQANDEINRLRTGHSN
ncbi:MAG: hypothetical protein Q9160_009175 [Pyrenula sp. 1 TL-2023]